jgi:hypothetical protein
MQSQNSSTLQLPKARWKVTSPTGKIRLSFSRANLFKKQEEHEVCAQVLAEWSHHATPSPPRPSLGFARGRANI